jgi:hypothetical protein
MVGYDGSNNEKVGSSSVEHISTAACSNKHQARPPTDHFERLRGESCPNHVYPIKNKLNDCDMMKNFMISGSLTQGMELNEDLGGSNMMPFPEEDAVLMVYDGRPPPGRHHVSNISPATPTDCGWGQEDTGM